MSRREPAARAECVLNKTELLPKRDVLLVIIDTMYRRVDIDMAYAADTRDNAALRSVGGQIFRHMLRRGEWNRGPNDCGGACENGPKPGLEPAPKESLHSNFSDGLGFVLH